MDDECYLYVSDYRKYEVKRYRLGEKNETIVAGREGFGNSPTHLWRPQRIFVDTLGNLCVADSASSMSVGFLSNKLEIDLIDD